MIPLNEMRCDDSELICWTTFRQQKYLNFEGITEMGIYNAFKFNIDVKQKLFEIILLYSVVI